MDSHRTAATAARENNGATSTRQYRARKSFPLARLIISGTTKLIVRKTSPGERAKVARDEHQKPRKAFLASPKAPMTSNPATIADSTLKATNKAKLPKRFPITANACS